MTTHRIISGVLLCVLMLGSVPVLPVSNIYAGDKLVATVVGTSTDAKVYINHLDHLGGTRAVSEYDGDTTQVLDYYPFGDSRISDQYASFDQKKKFTRTLNDRVAGGSVLCDYVGGTEHYRAL